MRRGEERGEGSPWLLRAEKYRRLISVIGNEITMWSNYMRNKCSDSSTRHVVTAAGVAHEAFRHVKRNYDVGGAPAMTLTSALTLINTTRKACNGQ